MYILPLAYMASGATPPMQLEAGPSGLVRGVMFARPRGDALQNRQPRPSPLAALAVPFKSCSCSRTSATMNATSVIDSQTKWRVARPCSQPLSGLVQFWAGSAAKCERRATLIIFGS